MERKPADAQIEFFAHYSTHLYELKQDAENIADSFKQEILSRPLRYWSDASARTFRDRAFAAMLRQHLPGHVYSIEAETETTINQALALLQELLPMAAHSAVSHLHFIATDDFDDEVGSATISRVLGTIFLSRSAVRSPWTIAEAILHECMHLKFVELEHTHSLMARDYSEKTSPRIHPPWHPETVTWPMNRALTAAHVYVALALYSVASEAAAPEAQTRYGPCKRSPILVDTRAAGERAHSLIDLVSQHPESLGQAGRMFLDWMRDILQKLATAPSLLHNAV
jgi:HEXXH motif-containing protein